MTTQIRKPANLTLDAALLEQARALKVNLSRAAEEGIRAATKIQQDAAWRKANQGALQSSNTFVETHGLPLQKHRQF